MRSPPHHPPTRALSTKTPRARENAIIHIVHARRIAREHPVRTRVHHPFRAPNRREWIGSPSPRSPLSSPNRRARTPCTRTNALAYARTHTHSPLTRRLHLPHSPTPAARAPHRRSLRRCSHRSPRASLPSSSSPASPRGGSRARRLSSASSRARVRASWRTSSPVACDGRRAMGRRPPPGRQRRANDKKNRDLSHGT